MLKSATIAGLALAGAVAATAATAHDSYSGYHTPHTTYTSPSYTAPTVNLGPIEYVQPNSTVQYQTYPSTTYYSSSSTIVPSATTTYTYPTTTYTQPSTTYYPSQTYHAPTYYAPVYDATDRVRSRLKRQRHRIRAALDRGDLRHGERKRLRRKMREIRDMFHSYKDNDGVIGYAEEQHLMRKLDRQSRRIARLANNHRVVGPYESIPYGGYYRY